jgi:hypothetical protein
MGSHIQKNSRVAPLFLWPPSKDFSTDRRLRYGAFRLEKENRDSPDIIQQLKLSNSTRWLKFQEQFRPLQHLFYGFFHQHPTASPIPVVRDGDHTMDVTMARPGDGGMPYWAKRSIFIENLWAISGFPGQ